MVATISRAEVLRRAATIWTPGTVPYSMVTNHQPDGYRQDCSGYVSMCWGLPAPGGSTVTMAPPEPTAIMFPITEAQLLPGDAIGNCGPGTGGANGHIQLFEARDPDGTGIWIWEQAGGTMGPRRRKVKTVGQGSGFTPWRFVGITGSGDDMLTNEEFNLIWANGWITQQLASMTDPIVVPPHPTTGYVGYKAPNLQAQALRAAGGDVDEQAIADALAANAAFAASIAAAVEVPTTDEIAKAVVDEEYDRLAE